MVDRHKIIQIFKASPTPTSIVTADDPDFSFLLVNDAYTKMTQRDEKELIGHSLFEAFPVNPDEEKPTGVDKLRESFQKVIANKQADELSRIRYDIRHGDSFQQKYWKVINTPVLGEDDEVELIVNSATNITKQVLSEQINNLMLNNTEDSFIYINLDLVIQDFNDLFVENYKDIFGVEVKTGESILDYAQPERREIVKSIYKQVFEGEIVEGELPLETSKGDFRYFTIKYKPARDNQGEIIGSFISLLEKTAEKKAKLELKQKEAQFRSLVEQGGDVVVIFDTDGYPKYITPSVENIFGYTIPEAKEINVNEVTHPEDFKFIEQAIKKAEKSPGKTVSVQPIRMKLKDNSWRWFETSITDLRHEPSVEGIVDNIRDVHEQVMTKQLLEQSKQKYQNVVEHSTIMFYQHDTEGVLNYVSPQSKKFLGHPPEKAMRNWTEYITDHPANKEGEKITQKAIETGEAQEPYELQLKTADNRIIWVEVNEAPLKENGEVVGIIGSLTDITERKQYEEELRKSLERYDYASKATRDAIYDWDIINDDLHWGEGFKTLFGHQPGDGTYPLKKYVESVHPDDNAEALKDLEFTLNDSSMNKWTFEYRFQKADGSYAHVVENGYIIRDGDGKAVRMIGAIRDISETKREEIQTQLQNRVSQFFKTKDRLNPILDNLLNFLTEYEKFSFAEIWLVSGDEKHLNLVSKFARDRAGNQFYKNTKNKTRVVKTEGLPGIVWENKKTEVWDNIDTEEQFIRNKAAKKSGIKSAFSLPLFYNEDLIGVLILGSIESSGNNRNKIEAYEILPHFLGAEIKRKQQEEEMLLLFESSPDILAITDPDNHFVKVNPSFCELMGYTEEELTSQPFDNFVHPDDLTSTRKEYQETITGQRQTDNFVNRLITKSGEYRWISWSTSDVFGEDNYMFAFGRDITEQAELEQLLNQAQRMARIGGWKLDLQHDEVYWSPITKNIHEVEPDFKPNLETGINFYKEGESRETIQKAIDAAIERGSSFDVELEIITANGNERWVRTKAEPVLLDGKCISLFGSFQDITDRKESEKELEKAYNEKETILESIGDAFFAVDKNWNVTYWNRAAERILQTPKSAILNQNIWDIYQDATEMPTYTYYHRVMHERKPVEFEDYYKGLNKWFSVSAYPSQNGISVFLKDITESKKARKELERLNDELKKQTEELEASNAELEQFAYVASHDLQEPLRMVSSFLTQLDKKYSGQLDEKANQYIHFAVDGSMRMRQIILDLLNYSRLNRDKNDREPTDLNKILDDVQSLERSAIEESGAIIEIESLPTLHINPGAIKQVFQNLIGNAIKYQVPNNTPKINVTVEESDTQWKFCVQDNGIGISPEYKETIFQIFQRLHTRDQYSGTGIGLAICKKIIERHDGEIWVESEEGKGSTFCFTLPKQ